MVQVLKIKRSRRGGLENVGVVSFRSPDGSGAYYLKTASSAPFDLDVHSRMGDD